MKINFKHIIFGVLFLMAISMTAQEEVKGYRIEGDEVVFTFNRSDYDRVTRDSYGHEADFKDLDIENVVVAGSFNNWSRNKWKMKKIGEGKYELRKKIEDFSDDFLWEFKFIINNTYWAEPNEEFPNITAARDWTGINELGSYNLKIYTAVPDKNGNAHFLLEGFDDADEVILSGTFSRWDEHFLKMNRTEKGWELNLNLKPGNYEYRFIVDGEWMADPANSDKVRNEFNDYNSIIRIKKKITFHLNNYPEASEVILTGSFNNWDEQQLRMKKTDSGWVKTLILPGGKHHYKYIVDGEWKVDPENTVMEYDGEGHINSVCMVK